MSKYEKYRRKQVAELRPVTPDETATTLQFGGVSISQVDLDNGSPKPGDMIARNPKNHEDRWLVAREYFEENFEPLGDD